MNSPMSEQWFSASRFPLLPLRSGSLLPGTRVAIPVGRVRSVALLDTLSPGALVAVVAQRDPAVSDPERADLHDTGTVARVTKIDRTRDQGFRVVLEGLGRFRLTDIVTREPFWLATGAPITETVADTATARLAARALRDTVAEGISREALATLTADESHPGALTDQLAGVLGLSPDRALAVLEATEVTARIRLVTGYLAEARALEELRSKVDRDVRQELTRQQREALLREQLKAIRRELGDTDTEGQTSVLREKLEKTAMPGEARTVALRELERLEAMNGAGPEAQVIRSYLECLLDLPWEARAEGEIDLAAIEEKLDSDHTGLDDVKKRILEHMAVVSLTGKTQGTIVCLVGPPGVGKTSLGQSIADATGRPFVRIALGGAHDEADIRGHRRTYIGAMPGRVIQALRRAKVKNPVVLLDEIDKLGTSWRTSPEAALLEVLDPEQNKTFTDHYVDLAFDLSEVLFVCTANDLSTLSAPLRDRLEIIELEGYTMQEKTRIAKRHLVPKVSAKAGLSESHWEITDTAIEAVIEGYTREAGVRQLKRELSRVARTVALEVARRTTVSEASRESHETVGVTVERDTLKRYLGREKFHRDTAEPMATPGVAMGLAWTPLGGDLLYIETSRMPGQGRVELTGQLGDVMKESARAALTFLRSNAKAIGVSEDALTDHDVHVHVPAGAVPKDGPSAGVTIFTALSSLFTGRRVRSDTALTGECTLRGRVMPVGGIKSKVLAAHRAGVTRVVLPSKNARDLDDIPQTVRDAMTFVLVDDLHQVLDAALENDTPTVDVSPRPQTPPLTITNRAAA